MFSYSSLGILNIVNVIFPFKHIYCKFNCFPYYNLYCLTVIWIATPCLRYDLISRSSWRRRGTRMRLCMTPRTTTMKIILKKMT